jgi:hypothetical protein
MLWNSVLPVIEAVLLYLIRQVKRYFDRGNCKKGEGGSCICCQKDANKTKKKGILPYVDLYSGQEY